MANPYENTGGVDPFKEPPTNNHTAYDEAVSPITLTYTIPSNPPSSMTADAQQTTKALNPQGGYETTFGVPLGAGAPSLATPAAPVVSSTTAASPAAAAGGASVFSLGYYQRFFNVTTRQVLNRMTNALFPICPPDYLQGRHWHFTTAGPAEGENDMDEDFVIAGVKLSRYPDLYGPFWICTTLWIIMGVIGNVMSRIAYARQHGGEHTDRWIFDFTLVPVACATIYLYCFVFGSIVWGVMKWKYLPVTLIDMVCLYGYSMFVFLLVALLCVVPSTAFQWVVVLVGGVWSSSYLVANLWHMLKRNLSPQWFLGIVGGVALGQLLLTLSFKLYFFRYSI